MAHELLSWQRLLALTEQFHNNVESLATRDLALATTIANLVPAHEWLVAAANSAVQLAQRGPDGTIEQLANPVPPAAASRIAAKLYPTGRCTEPVLVAGLDQGWLWQSVFKLETHTPSAPGHTPPLYLLTPDAERLWAVLHLHDWRELLAHPRTRLFVGADCLTQCHQSMKDNIDIPLPRLSVTIDPSTWPAGTSLDTLTADVLRIADSRVQSLVAQIDSHARRDASGNAWASLARGGRLRVLGITSRYTTFLQYSMRDWLRAFEALGHETRLVIEAESASLANPVTFAEVSADFRPDLIVMIDHYRAAFNGLPKNVPWIMWIQDQLPHLFRRQAGAAQQELDYTIGYGRLDCVHRHGYPAERFLPTAIGTNEHRFQPRRLTHAERARHVCDVSFVSHSSRPVELLLSDEIARQKSPASRPVLERVLKKLQAHYARGTSVTAPADFRQIVGESLRELSLNMDDPSALLTIVSQKLNNALFRHQALEWVADTCDRENFRLHLYGRGWDSHPRFAKYARGEADNEQELSAIYQASKVNLQISPFGSAHQRVYDGLAAGGFFLLRHCPGDRAYELYRELYQFCLEHNITNDAHLRACAADVAGHPEVAAWVAEIGQLTGEDALATEYDFVTELSHDGRAGFIGNAATLWDEYRQVAFASRDELQTKLTHFVRDDAARAAIARDMRQRVLDTVTYTAITRRALRVVAEDLKLKRTAGRTVLAA